MAIAHICHHCGVDLARVRALLDPHYRLPLVRCPRCQCHQVRRSHPLIVRWRQVLHLMQATTHCLVAIFILLIIIIYCLAVSGSLLEGLMDLWRALQTESQNRPGASSEIFMDAMIIFGGLSAAALSGGAFVAGILRHWKRWLAWLTWFLLLILIAFRPIWATGYHEVMHTLHPDTWRASVGIDWTAFFQSILGVLIIYGVSFAGAPIGWAGVRIAANSRIARRKKRRASRRRQQRS